MTARTANHPRSGSTRCGRLALRRMAARRRAGSSRTPSVVGCDARPFRLDVDELPLESDCLADSSSRGQDQVDHVAEEIGRPRPHPVVAVLVVANDRPEVIQLDGVGRVDRLRPPLDTLHLSSWIGDHEIVHDAVGTDLTDQCFAGVRLSRRLPVDGLVDPQDRARLDLSKRQGSHQRSDLLLDQSPVLVPCRIPLIAGERNMFHVLMSELDEERVRSQTATRRVGGFVLVPNRFDQRPPCLRPGGRPGTELAVAPVDATEL